MCRWIAWLSHPDEPILLANVINKAHHNLALQATRHEKGLWVGDDWIADYGYPQNPETNIDGWGIGWYSLVKSRQAHNRIHDNPHIPRAAPLVDLLPELIPRPAIFRSIMPIIHDPNVQDVVESVESHCIFGHIRSGTPLMIENSHPFKFGHYLFQHNGYYRPFWRIQARLLMYITHPPRSEHNPSGRSEYNPSDYIKGSTDSEHIAALFFFVLGRPEQWNNFHDINTLHKALVKTINLLAEWAGPYRQSGIESGIRDDLEYASLNISITDGEQLVALCYGAPSHRRTAGSLYYSTTAGPKLNEQHHDTFLKASFPRHVIVASERSTSDERDWIQFNNGDLLLVGRGAFDYDVRSRVRSHNEWDEDAWGTEDAKGRWWPKVVSFEGVARHLKL